MVIHYRNYTKGSQYVNSLDKGKERKRSEWAKKMSGDTKAVPGLCRLLVLALVEVVSSHRYSKPRRVVGKCLVEDGYAGL